MRELLQSPFFGITLTVAAYVLGMKIQKKIITAPRIRYGSMETSSGVSESGS